MRRDPRAVLMYAMPLLLAAAMMMSGCTYDVARWTPAEAPKENKIDFVVMTHQIHFAPGTATPANGEAKALSDFLDTVALTYGDQVTIDAGPQSGNAASDLLATSRLDAVSSMLRKMSIRAKPASRPTVDGALNHDGVVVTVGRYVVTGPSCPNRTKIDPDDYTNTTESNYGCATSTNLGLMVANPGDLVRGTPAGPADGEFAARGIQNYRSGANSKAVKSELTGSGGSN